MLPYAILPIYAASSTWTDLVTPRRAWGRRPRAIADVVLPLVAPSIFAAAAIAFVISLGFYITPILLGGPDSPFLATFVDIQIYRLSTSPGRRRPPASCSSPRSSSWASPGGWSAWIGSAGVGMTAKWVCGRSAHVAERPVADLVFMVAPSVVVLLLSFPTRVHPLPADRLGISPVRHAFSQPTSG